MINIPDGYFKGRKKGQVRKFNTNVHNINHRMYQAKLKGESSIRFIKGAGKSYLLDDEEFEELISLIESQFDVNLECSYAGDGEKFFVYTIGWE